jgi:hypothetical protein
MGCRRERIGRNGKGSRVAVLGEDMATARADERSIRQFVAEAEKEGAKH